MRIIAKESTGRSIRLILPTGLLLNRMTAGMLPGVLETKGISVSREQAVKIVQTIRSCRKKHPGWKLLEAESSDGGYVEITL